MSSSRNVSGLPDLFAQLGFSLFYLVIAMAPDTGMHPLFKMAVLMGTAFVRVTYLCVRWYGEIRNQPQSARSVAVA